MRGDRDRTERARRALEDQQRLDQQRIGELAVTRAQEAAANTERRAAENERLASLLAEVTEQTLQRLEAAGFPNISTIHYLSVKHRLFGEPKEIVKSEPGWNLNAPVYRSTGDGIYLLASGLYYYNVSINIERNWDEHASPSRNIHGVCDAREFAQNGPLSVEAMVDCLNRLGQSEHPYNY